MTTLADLVARRRVVLCCGTGGVGKTTTAAVIALVAARQGRNAVVVTIDPAKRLADTLGLAELGNTAREIPRGRWADPAAAPGGHLSALMLDTRATFDDLVRRYAEDGAQADRILENRFYRNIAGALSGTQEYMAMEKLHELHDEGGYDLIVVDTPPTRHALDFLDAPQRLTRLLDNRIFRLLMMPTRTYLRLAGAAVQRFLRTVGKVIGTEVLDDIVAFFRAFEGMEQGFRDRASRVDALLAEPETAFVLITSPRRDAVDEAEFFSAQLRDADIPVDALIVNRVDPDFGSPAPAATLRDRADALDRTDGEAARRLAARFRNLADYVDLGSRERHDLADLGHRIGAGTIAYVPSLSHDIVDFSALTAVATHLFADHGEGAD
ncbi:MAG TPA: ArsA-related P-loop ATPase [Acidimicrobiia bacterium]|nr:ArsA-related P-loop ATPase [Acidimicrobiia bacterium]